MDGPGYADNDVNRPDLTCQHNGLSVLYMCDRTKKSIPCPADETLSWTPGYHSLDRAVASLSFGYRFAANDVIEEDRRSSGTQANIYSLVRDGAIARLSYGIIDVDTSR